jgi:hypothetical protein
MNRPEKDINPGWVRPADWPYPEDWDSETIWCRGCGYRILKDAATKETS